jgi:histidine ammonia-lyase
MQMIGNLNAILAVELLCAAQGIGFRAPLRTSAPLRAVVAHLRAFVPALTADRAVAPDMAEAARLVAEGSITAASGIPLPELEDPRP